MRGKKSTTQVTLPESMTKEPRVMLNEGFEIAIRSNAQRAKVHGFVPHVDRFRDLLEAVLIFHAAEWSADNSRAWRNRIDPDGQVAEATTKVLCDRIRSLLGGI